LIPILMALVLPGFLIERARGGKGVIGGGLSAALIIAVYTVFLGIVLIALSPTKPGVVETLAGMLLLMFPSMLFAFCLGWTLSWVLYTFLNGWRTIFNRPLRDESCGHIRWHPLHDGEPNRQSSISSGHQ
jgi:hypothetical protein